MTTPLSSITPSHTAPSSPNISNAPKRKQWSWQGAGRKDLAACAKHKVWDLKHKKVSEGWNKVQNSTWAGMAEEIKTAFKQPSRRGCQHRYMEYTRGHPDAHTDLTPHEQIVFTELLSDIRKRTEVSDKMKEWKDEKKGVKSKHKETAMKQRSAMMKKMVRDDEEEEDSEEETIDDSTVSSSSTRNTAKNKEQKKYLAMLSGSTKELKAQLETEKTNDTTLSMQLLHSYQQNNELMKQFIQSQRYHQADDDHVRYIN